MTIAYVNFNLANPRDQITLRGLRECGVTLVEIADRTPGWRKYAAIARALRAREGECDAVMVGYAGSVLVIVARLVSRKKLVYNALATFYDSIIISRAGGSLYSLSSLWHYLIDYIAFRCADKIFLECQAQKELAAKVYRIDPQKISVHFVGTDDAEFYFDPAVHKASTFTAIFRGMFLAEAGADVVVRAAKELDGTGVRVRIIGRGLLLPEIKLLVDDLRPANLELITERLPIAELRRSMLECHLSLGQLAEHPRVHTTIPHKAFESMAMRLPYLTGENKGVMEILKDGETCFSVPPGDHHTLARKIVWLRDRPQELERVAGNSYRLYQKEFTPKILGRKIVEDIAPLEGKS